MMYYFFLVAVLIVPGIAAAQGTTFKGVVGNLLEFNQLLVMVIFALAFLVVLWKIVDAWILKGGSPEAIESGKKTILIAVIVLAIMSGIWGILEILTSSFSGVIGV